MRGLAGSFEGGGWGREMQEMVSRLFFPLRRGQSRAQEASCREDSRVPFDASEAQAVLPGWADSSAWPTVL